MRNLVCDGAEVVLVPSCALCHHIEAAPKHAAVLPALRFLRSRYRLLEESLGGFPEAVASA